ncbi:hypothetical protein D3C77_554770 [compost metagenome]
MCQAAIHRRNCDSLGGQPPLDSVLFVVKMAPYNNLFGQTVFDDLHDPGDPLRNAFSLLLGRVFEPDCRITQQQ